MALRFTLKQISNGWVLNFFDDESGIEIEEFHESFEKAEKRMAELQRGKRW